MAVLCVAGQTYTLEFGLEDQSNAGLWKANPTIAAGDFQISVNGGAFENVDNIPTVTPAAGRRVALVISAAETTAAAAGGLIFIQGVDAAGSEWYDVAFSVRVVASSGDVAQTGADGDTLETLSDQLDAIVTDTAEIGAAGAGLTAVPWNANWDAEVQSECNDALVALDLDHFIQVTAGSEEPTDGSYLDQIMHKNSSQTFDATTDSLEAIRDHLSSGSVTVSSSVTASGVVTIRRGDSLSAAFTDLGSIAGRSKLWFTVKDHLSDTDAQSIIQIEETAGLVYLNGAAGTAGLGDITVSDEDDGDLTVTLDETATDDLSYASGLYYDIQVLISGSVSTIATGTANVTLDVTRAVA